MLKFERHAEREQKFQSSAPFLNGRGALPVNVARSGEKEFRLWLLQPALRRFVATLSALSGAARAPLD